MTAATGLISRLTAGWQESGYPPTLTEHSRRFGELPRRSRGGTGIRNLAGQVAAAGLTGRGGAGFPTGVKMQAVASHRGPKVVVGNGMESEPASEKDQALLARAPHLVLDGVALAAEAVGADAAYLCVPRDREWLTDILLRARQERWQAGTDRVDIQVQELPHHYVASEESSLVHWLNGGEAKPTMVPPRPFERGVRRRPTLINNVETLAHLALIARFGPDWFRQAGRPDAPGTMLASVSGAVAEPGVYEIAVGTRIEELLRAAGASTASEAVLIGGYFGTWHPTGDVARLPFSKAGLAPAGGAPGAGVLFVLPPGSCGLMEAARILHYLADQGAQQCGPCIFGLPAIAGDLTQLANGHPDGDALGRMRRRFDQIDGRGACRHPDGAVRMAASALTAFTADVHAHSRRRPCTAGYRGQRKAAILPVPSVAAEGGWR